MEAMNKGRAGKTNVVDMEGKQIAPIRLKMMRTQGNEQDLPQLAFHL